MTRSAAVRERSCLARAAAGLPEAGSGLEPKSRGWRRARLSDRVQQAGKAAAPGPGGAGSGHCGAPNSARGAGPRRGSARKEEGATRAERGAPHSRGEGTLRSGQASVSGSRGAAALARARVPQQPPTPVRKCPSPPSPPRGALCVPSRSSPGPPPPWSSAASLFLPPSPPSLSVTRWCPWARGALKARVPGLRDTGFGRQRAASAWDLGTADRTAQCRCGLPLGTAHMDLLHLLFLRPLARAGFQTPLPSAMS